MARNTGNACLRYGKDFESGIMAKRLLTKESELPLG